VVVELQGLEIKQKRQMTMNELLFGFSIGVIWGAYIASCFYRKQNGKNKK
jgi:hypothetical protein